MRWLSRLPLPLLLPALLLLASCTASEKAARLARREQFKADRLAFRNGQRQPKEIVKHTIGEDPKEVRRRNRQARSRKRFDGSEDQRITGTRKLTNQDVAAVIRTARSYTGTPYLAGGTTRIGMDCSGLICSSFEAIDLKLPRNSTDQSNFGQPVSLEELKEGDLVFFGPSRNSSQISHVGLVTDVKSKEEITFIHSSTSLGVTENNLFSKYYYERFVKATRPVSPF